MEKNYLLLENNSAISCSKIPQLTEVEFDQVCLNALKDGKCRISAFFALPCGEKFLLTAVFADPEQKGFRVLQSAVTEKFNSLTAHIPAFNRFEREIFESCGLYPVGHPKLKPLRFTGGKVGEMDFYRMGGKAVHEVAVGPVHAGVIEPGHFRFQCMGEKVYSLEISLGYQHRGVEKLLLADNGKKFMHLLETAAGDSSIAAAWNGAKIIEAFHGIAVDENSSNLRQIALELERCANHIGDLGALAGDVAFLPTASFCGRIRGEYLNMTAELCGNRFGRNFIVPGGCCKTMDSILAAKLIAWLERVSPELWEALDLMFASPTVLDRFENTGTVSKESAVALGLTGVAARACGLKIDSREDFPAEFEQPEMVDCRKFTGDVLSRAQVRYYELKKSHDYLFAALKKFTSPTSVSSAVFSASLPPDHFALAVTEAWRGELCYAAVTNDDGRLAAFKIVDPSFHNWEGLAMALRDEEISHFPICNKSFNLSYCGHDL